MDTKELKYIFTLLNNKIIEKLQDQIMSFPESYENKLSSLFPILNVLVYYFLYV